MQNAKTTQAGERVIFKKDLDLSPHTIVRAGETGTIVASGLTFTPFVEIALDVLHKGLVQYDNIAWLCPDFQDVAEYVGLITSVAA